MGSSDLTPTSSYGSPVSQWEARYHLNFFKNTKYDHPLQEAFREQSIRDNQKLLNDYEKGKAYYQPLFAQIEVSRQVENLIVPSRTEANEALNYPKKIKVPNIISQHLKSIVKISNPNFDDLKKDEPFGTIDPPTRTRFFPNSELLVPLPGGFRRNLGLDEVYKSSPMQPFTAQSPKGYEETKISIPKLNQFLPIPNNAQLVSIEGDSKISHPMPYDPIVWRHNSQSPNLSFSIERVDQPYSVDLHANSSLVPSQEEQEYWSQALPLPEILKQKIQESPKDLLPLLVSYMALPDKETGLTNCTYQANADFNDFLEENKKDMPLIVSELKSGHCDLLSWYLAALIRAHGKPAWVSRGLIPTIKGRAFQGAYGHSTVMTLDDNGKVLQIDPAQYTKLDQAYLHQVFPDNAFHQMANQFKKAKTNKEKQKLLRNFREVLARTRESINNDPEKQKKIWLDQYIPRTNDSLDDFQYLYFSRELKAQLVDFRKTLEPNRDYSIEDLFDFLPFYDGYDDFERSIPDFIKPSPRKISSAKAERENFGYFLTLAKRMKFPIFDLGIKPGSSSFSIELFKDPLKNKEFSCKLVKTAVIEPYSLLNLA